MCIKFLFESTCYDVDPTISAVSCYAKAVQNLTRHETHMIMRLYMYASIFTRRTTPFSTPRVCPRAISAETQKICRQAHC